jgi:hypothetical protein
MKGLGLRVKGKGVKGDVLRVKGDVLRVRVSCKGLDQGFRVTC